MKRFTIAAVLLFGAAACQDRLPVEPALAPEGVLSEVTPMNHSHGRFFHISWFPRPDLSPTTVEFVYSAAFRRSGYGSTCRQFSGGVWSIVACTGPGGQAGPGDIVLETVGGTNFVFGDGTQTPTLFFQVTSINVAEDWAFFVAVDPATGTPNLVKQYPNNGPFTATSFTCCRIGGLQNPGAFYGAATVVELGAGNRSPVSNIVPIVNVVQGGVKTWAIPANDPDGDPLRFSLTNVGDWPLDGAQPIAMGIDANTGVVSWDTDGRPLGLYWTNVTIEELNSNGSPKGLVMVDYLVNLVQQAPDNDPPFFTSPAFCGSSVQTAPGSLLSFDVDAEDPDAGDVVSLSASGVPTGAAFDPGTPGNPVNGSFSWTPTTGQTGSHIVTFSATDQHGAQALCPVTILVSTTGPPDPDPPGVCENATVVPLDLIWSGNQPNGTIHAGDPNVFAVTFNIDQYLDRPNPPPNVRFGDSWATGTPAHTTQVGSFAAPRTGGTDIMVVFSTQQLLDDGNLTLGTQEVQIWGFDDNEEEMFCAHGEVEVVNGQQAARR